jgi:hypothetical protein
MGVLKMRRIDDRWRILGIEGASRAITEEGRVPEGARGTAPSGPPAPSSGVR